MEGDQDNVYTKSNVCYPDQAMSESHNRRNLVFPIGNWKYTAISTVLSALSILLHSLCTGYLGSNAAMLPAGGAALTGSLCQLLALSLVPLFFVMVVYSVKPTEPSPRTSTINRVSFSLLYSISLAANLAFVCCPGIATLFGSLHDLAARHPLLLNLAAILSLGVLQSWLFGLYLFIEYRFARRNITEASSSHVQVHYNHFLRMRITQNGITIYPISVAKAYNWEKAVNTSPYLQQEIKAQPDYGAFLKSTFKEEYSCDDFRILEKVELLF